MGGLTEGERQRREVNSYNLFYSALTARATPSLADCGVTLPMVFPVIEAGDTTVEPDFVLYDGSVCVLAEIKSGNNVDPRDVDQMRRCDTADIETMEAALKTAQVRERTPYDGTVTGTDSIVVYQDLNEEYIETVTSQSDEFSGLLAELTSHATLLTQDYGGTLRVLDGAFDNESTLTSLLSNGIELPERPPDELMLTEAMEPEILAVAIADIWGEQALDHDDGVTVSRGEVRNFFAPRYNIPLSDLSLVFDFLIAFGACERVDDHRYRFTRDNVERIIQVEQQVMDETVETFLHGSGQTSLDEF